MFYKILLFVISLILFAIIFVIVNPKFTINGLFKMMNKEENKTSKKKIVIEKKKTGSNEQLSDFEIIKDKKAKTSKK